MRRSVVIAVTIIAAIAMTLLLLETSKPVIPQRTNETVSPSKPVIKISYTPTKVMNDKIYDMRVHVEVRDDRTPIAHAKLLFIPVKYDYFITEYGMRPEDYPKAFPNVNDNRTFVLRPVDGSFDELREEFVADIKNITGGGEYRIVVIARDAAGNENIVEIKTPYIRQFENFGKQLYEKGIIVGSSYYTWYQHGVNNWKDGYKCLKLLRAYFYVEPFLWKFARSYLMQPISNSLPEF